MLTIFFACFLALSNQSAPKLTPQTQAKIIQIAQHELASLNSYKLNASEETHAKVLSSPSGYHVRFSRTWQGLPVWESRPAHVHLNKNLQPVTMQAGQPLTAVEPFYIQEQHATERATHWLKKEKNVDQVQLLKSQRGYSYEHTKGYPRFQMLFSIDQDQLPVVIQLDVDGQSGQVITSFQRTLFHQKSLPEGQIFRHNPVAGAARGDSRSQDALVEALVRVPLRNLDDSGYLRGAYVDTTAPGIPTPMSPRSPYRDYQPGAAFSQTGHYIYPPDNPAFEEVMVYYWMDSAQRWLQSLDFRIHDRPIAVNCHLFSGQNAFYNSYLKFIGFGDGMVDSAEDGSVITHEYGHAILDDILGERLYDAFGSMFHEGFADYFSFVVARAAATEVGPDLYPEYLGEWSAIFTGPSPYLRSLLPPAFSYPDLRYESHGDGQLWSSAFFEMDQKVGGQTFPKTLLESLYLTSSARPNAVFDALIQADTLLNNGQHAALIEAVLRDRGLLQPELKHDILELEPGHEYPLKESSKLTFYHFKAPADIEQLNIDMDASVKTVLLAKGRLPSFYDFDKQFETFEALHWALTTSGSKPALVTGEDYYLAIKVFAPTTLRLQPFKTMEPVALNIPPNEPFHTLVSLNRPASFHFNGEDDPRLRFWIETGPEYQGMVYLSSLAPHTYADAYSNDVLGLYVNSYTPMPIVVELPAGFRTNAGYYLTIDSDFEEEEPLVVRWDAQPAPPWPQIQPHQLASDQVLPDGLSQYTFNIQDDLDSLWIFSDADHPFVLYTPQNQEFYSSLFQGRQTVFFHRDGAELVGLEKIIIGHWLYQGSYRIRVQGEVGSQYQLEVLPNYKVAIPDLHDGLPQDLCLQENELTVFHLDVPADATGFSLHFPEPPEGGSLHYNLFADDGATTSFRNDFGFHYRENRREFRQTMGQLPFTGGELTPGVGYQLWLYNDSHRYMDVNVTYHVEYDQIEPTHLTDDNLITLNWETRYLRDDDVYVMPFLVTPPEGTKRVLFDFEYLAGNRDIYLTVRAPDGTWDLNSLFDVSLSRFNLGFVPNRPFEITFFVKRNLNYVAGPIRFKAGLAYDLDHEYDLVLEESGSANDQLKPFKGHQSLLMPPQPVRGIALSWAPTGMSNNEYLQIQAERNREPADLSTFNQFFGNEEVPAMGIFPTSRFTPLVGDHWVLKQTLSSNSRFFVVDPEAKPLDLDFSVQYLPFDTDTLVPSDPLLFGDESVVRTIQIISPHQDPLTVVCNGHETLVSPGGFLLETLSESETMRITAEKPVLIYQYHSGVQAETLASFSPFFQGSLLLPHLPPRSSTWQSMLSLTHSGERDALLRATQGDARPIEPGVTSFMLEAFSEQAGLTEIKSEQDHLSPPETAFAGTQYWRQGHRLAAEQAGASKGHHLYLAHFPNPNDWWVGLSLANPNDQPATIQVIGFDGTGGIVGSKYITIAPNESKVGLIEQFLPDEVLPGDIQWLRFDSPAAAVAGVCFMGTLRQNGDVACFGLPVTASGQIVFPSSNGQGFFSLALLNTQSGAGLLTLEAVNRDGRVLARHTDEMGPRQKKLYTGTTLFPGLDPSSYYVKATAMDVSIIGLFLNGNQRGGLSAQSGEAVR